MFEAAKLHQVETEKMWILRPQIDTPLAAKLRGSYPTIETNINFGSIVRLSQTDYILLLLYT